MKLSVFHVLMKIPRKVWILAVLLVTLLLLTVYIGSRPASSEKSAPHAQVSPTPAPTPPPPTSNNHQNSEASAAKTPSKVPPRLRDFLIGAVVASFILAAFISVNRRDLEGKMRQTFLIG